MNSSPRRWPAWVATTALAVAALIAVAGVGAAVWGSMSLTGAQGASAAVSDELAEATAAKDVAQEEHDAREAAERQRQVEQQSRADAATLVRERDRGFAELGYQPAGSGVYFQWVPTDQFSCGSWDCAAVWLVAAEGCPTSLYIEAAIMNGNAQVGMTNELTTSIPAWGQASVMFEDYTESGDGFRVTKVNCY
jgi:hypothetical protein